MRKDGKVLVLRSSRAGGVAYGGFVWPTEIGATVTCPDWNSAPHCGNGLHGWLWGEGDGSLENRDGDAVWHVLEVDGSSIVELGGKVKFPSCVVVACGDRQHAVDFIQREAPQAAVIYGTATAGDYGTAAAGYLGTATAWDHGTATAGNGGTLIISWRDGDRRRLSVGYVGEIGIEAGKPYRLNDRGEFVEVSDA